MRPGTRLLRLQVHHHLREVGVLDVGQVLFHRQRIRSVLALAWYRPAEIGRRRRASAVCTVSVWVSSVAWSVSSWLGSLRTASEICASVVNRSLPGRAEHGVAVHVHLHPLTGRDRALDRRRDADVGARRRRTRRRPTRCRRRSAGPRTACWRGRSGSGGSSRSGSRSPARGVGVGRRVRRLHHEVVHLLELRDDRRRARCRRCRATRSASSMLREIWSLRSRSDVQLHRRHDVGRARPTACCSRFSDDAWSWRSASFANVCLQVRDSELSTSMLVRDAEVG